MDGSEPAVPACMIQLPLPTLNAAAGQWLCPRPHDPAQPLVVAHAPTADEIRATIAHLHQLIDLLNQALPKTSGTPPRRSGKQRRLRLLK